ncbi:SpoIID/LytB domain-containing protein [Acidicapsa ligni]|uniref:SpoIID/LytB domain-containing protein n=1 Tax=Acidicapsa ligni TaxID=542300 RepID=UPI0021E064AB|nr:SpoIID/LytB domain-containing protein [Acidicapsa ligni]
MLFASLGAVAATSDGSGGRDISVALFSTQSLRTVTVTPIGAHAWTSLCAKCIHTPLTAPLHVIAPKEIFAGGSLRVTDDATGEMRTATGLWHLQARRQNVDVVLTLPSERYVAAVLNAEAAHDEPGQSLRALAILARTYALNGSHFVAQHGHLSADLCDSTACQAMLPGSASLAIEDAVRATAGETLWFGPHQVEVFFSQNCGGLTEDAGILWPKLRGTPYLRSHGDPYCGRRDTAAWHADVPLGTLLEVAQKEGWHLPARIVTAHVAERSPSRRALRVLFTGADGATSMVSASALRFGIGRTMGWNRVRSDAYELGVRNGELVFDGRGHGHGVGLCQVGATEMASEGKNAREILAFYFSGTTVRILPEDMGWQETRVGPLALRATHVFSAEKQAEIERMWGDAEKRFPPQQEIHPEIIFASTTEVFRQLTTQPGWALASTRGDTIVLQPEAILHARGRVASETLMHEMLHVLVESESNERTPLWLREGLVEVLAGEHFESAHTMSIDEIESALQHTDSLRASESAHLAAASRVHALLIRYGVSSVRGWLSSGVPAGVR